MVLLVALAAVRLFWAHPEPPVDENWQQVRRSGVLRVGLDASHPPFEYVDAHTGELLGYDVDLAHLIGERLDLEVELTNSGFDGLYPALDAGRFDCIISAFPYDSLLTHDVRFSVPYFQAGLALVVADDAIDIASVDDLTGQRLAVEWGATGDVRAGELRSRMRDLVVLRYPTANAALESVVAGAADAALVDAVSAYQSLQSYAALRVVQEGITDESYVILVSRDSPILLDAINDVLDDLRDDSSLEALRRKWL
jgi:ABC-type amino acid transport substrate-binding protein